MYRNVICVLQLLKSSDRNRNARRDLQYDILLSGRVVAATKIQWIFRRRQSPDTTHYIYCCFINYNVRWVRGRRQSTSTATVTNARPAPVERGDTTPLHDCNNELISTRRPYADGSLETRQQCSRSGRSWQSPRRFLLCVTSTRALLCHSPRCSPSFSSLPQIRSDGRNNAAARFPRNRII